MSRAVSIDIVVPTSRAEPATLSKIVSLEVPRDTTVSYYIVLDRPGPMNPALQELTRQTNVILLANGHESGAASSRNRGFEAGSGDVVLFIDDDVAPNPSLLHAYRAAVDKEPGSPGFAGTARFAPALNSFTRGMVASGIPDVWAMAETHAALSWNVTSNVMVRRRIANGLRFSLIFPKGGGGEDVDYGIRLTSKAGRPLVSVPTAIVVHDWWNGGTRQYRRLFRWGYGDSWLGELHPEHRFFTAPNLLETLVLGTLVMVALAGAGLVAPMTAVVWGSAIILVELSVEAVRLATGAGRFGVRVSFEATLIRLANDLGRLAGNLRRGRLPGFMERFDYFCTRETVQHERSLATIKFGLFLIASVLVLALQRFI